MLPEFEKYTAILFDWDGCLAKTIVNWLQAYSEIYTKYGVSFTKEAILQKSWGNVEEGPKNFGIADYQTAWREIVTRVAELNRQVPLYDGVSELLTELHNSGKKLAIVTTSELQVVEPALQFNHIAQYFDGVFSEEMVHNPKPDPEIVNLALQKLGARKEEAIIVGDTAKDIIAGHNAGIASMLVLHEENKTFYDFEKMKVSNPTYIVNGFTDKVE